MPEFDLRPNRPDRDRDPVLKEMVAPPADTNRRCEPPSTAEICLLDPVARRLVARALCARRTDAMNLDLVGLALHGPKRAVDKAVKGLALHA